MTSKTFCSAGVCSGPLSQLGVGSGPRRPAPVGSPQGPWRVVWPRPGRWPAALCASEAPARLLALLARRRGQTDSEKSSSCPHRGIRASPHLMIIKYPVGYFSFRVRLIDQETQQKHHRRGCHPRPAPRGILVPSWNQQLVLWDTPKWTETPF